MPSRGEPSNVAYEAYQRRASAIIGDFLTSPAPKVDVLPPNEDNYRKKIAFERDRLAAWF